jgi:hypothetical protein
VAIRHFRRKASQFLGKIGIQDPLKRGFAPGGRHPIPAKSQQNLALEQLDRFVLSLCSP